MTAAEDAISQWRALQEAAVHDERLRDALSQLVRSPGLGESALRQWLNELGVGAAIPPALATYVSGGHVERLVNIARAQTVNLVVEQPVPQALFGLPADVADFTGRETDIGELLELFAREQGAHPVVRIAALAGKPGVGKSALAIHVAHRLSSHYSGAQLYVNLRGAEADYLDPAEVLFGLLEALGHPAHRIPLSLDQRVAELSTGCDCASSRSLVVSRPSRCWANSRVLSG